MKQFRKFVVQPLVAGVLFLAPIYLATLLLLKAMKSLGGLVCPLAQLLLKSLPGETVISFSACDGLGHPQDRVLMCRYSGGSMSLSVNRAGSLLTSLASPRYKVPPPRTTL